MEKVEQLIQILKRLNSGEDPAKVKEEARDFLATIEPADLSLAEQKLIDEGLSPDDLQRLCDIHLEMLGSQVKNMKSQLPAGHIISTLVGEHEKILGFLDNLQIINSSIQKMTAYDSSRQEFRKLAHIAEHLVEAELHHQREERVLFPALERKGIYGPPMVMKAEHAQLRPRKHQLKDLADSISEMDFDKFKKQLDELVRFIVPTLREHIFKENNILYPSALQVIKDEQVWLKLKQECDKIGYCCFSPQS